MFPLCLSWAQHRAWSAGGQGAALDAVGVRHAAHAAQAHGRRAEGSGCALVVVCALPAALLQLLAHGLGRLLLGHCTNRPLSRVTPPKHNETLSLT